MKDGVNAKRPGLKTVMDYLASLVAPTIVDVGAYIGKITRLALEANPAIVSYAIEPDPENLKLLIQNFGTNPNVHIHGCVIGDRSGKVPLYILDRPDQLGTSESNTLFAKVMKHKRDSLDVKARSWVGEVDSMTMDDFFAIAVQPPVVDLVKLNCEGGEYLIFGTPKHDWLKRTRMVWVSWHAQVKPFTKPEYAAKREAGCALLVAEGFQMVDGMDIAKQKKHIWQVWKRVSDAV